MMSPVRFWEVIVVFRAALVLAAVLATPLGSAADEVAKRPFEITDYYRTAFVRSPSVSHDGARVAFTVTRYELERGESWTELWLAAADGTNLKQLTFDRAHHASPRFSPDGTQLLFLSDRGGDTTQLWVMPLDGGEARQLTHFPLSLAGPVWSPDSRFVAVRAEVYPECAADAECNRTLSESVDSGPLEVHLADELLYRHWDSWREGRYSHVLLVNATTGEAVRDLTPGAFDSPPRSARDGGYAFSPDGKELCFVSVRDSDPASSTNADLYLVRLDEELPSPPTRLTSNPGWDGDLHFSPDGRVIAFRSQATPGHESDLFRLSILDRSTGTVTHLNDRGRFDDWVTGLAWTADGAWLVVQADVRGRNPLFRVNLASGRFTRLLEHGTIGGWELVPGAVVYVHHATGEPPELYRAHLPDGAPERLTRFNAGLEAEVDVRPAEELWVAGDGGVEVQVFVVKPHGFDPARQYPLILNVHGGPQMQWQDSYRGDWQVYPGKGYVVAFANPTGSTGRGQAYVDGISCDWGGRVMRDLAKVTDALAELPWVDAERMGAMGWSWGGYAMMWLEGHPHRFKALASMMGVYDLRAMYSATEELWFVEHDLCGLPWTSDDYREWSPSELVPAFKTPCLVITGERDYRVPYTQSLAFFNDLQKMEVPSRLAVFPNAGHWPSWQEMAFYYLLHLDWFHQWLAGDPPPWDLTRYARNQVFPSEGEEKD